MKIKNLVFAVMAAFALNHCANADTIGVGVSTGPTRNDPNMAVGYEFYTPSGATINALGFWDASGAGLLAAHTVSIFHYNGAGYTLLATATVPAGSVAPLINNYRWVGIPTLTLTDHSTGGGFYAILATQQQDTWANTPFAAGQYMNPAIGSVSGYGYIPSGSSHTLLSSTIPGLNGNLNAGDGYAGPNLAFFTTPPASQPAATPILWIDQGVFIDNTVLSVAGTPANEVYGVGFGAGPQTTANGYTFADFATSGNMTLIGSTNNFDSFLGGGGTTGDSSLDALLNNGFYGDASIYGTLRNLTIGQKYNVLAIAADTRGASAQFAVTDELGVSPSQTYKFPGGTPSVGGYVMGTFTATGTNQVFTIESGDIQYHAILVEKVPADAIILVTNTLPASATAAVSSNVVFTAAFSNSPAVSFQWQQIVSGSPNVTNDINTGVVIWTNNGVVASTLTLNNLQLTNAGSYRLKATDKGNSSNFGYSTPAPLTIIPMITWYAAGTYNNSFSDNTVLTLAGTPANEVYGVNFAFPAYFVAEPVTTANGYTFDDYSNAPNNMSIAGTISYYDGYFNGSTVSTGDPGLDSMLTHGVYGNSDHVGTLNNLTVGQTYTVLVLLADTRGTDAGGSVFHVTDGVTVSPGQQYAYANGTPKAGGYIMGTFTAQATNQPLTVLNVLGAASQYNAILLEKGIALPPPIAPTLTTDVTPLQSEVPVGVPMTFSVAASGAVPIHYQWSNQGGLITDATNAAYSFNALAGTNSYHVSVSNPVSAIASSTAVVIGETSLPPLVSFNNTDWVLNNNGHVTPSIVGSLLTLTDGNDGEASSAFFDVGQYIGGFVASFTYQNRTNGGADGITFSLQNSPAGTNALGNSGGGLGYAGITPSAAFEMNIYAGAIHGGVGIRVGTNGVMGDWSNDGYNSTAPVNYTNGNNIYVQLYYQSGVMRVLMIDPTALTTNTSSFAVNLPATVGNSSAYLGFTGADGGITSFQTVSNLLYSYTTPPILSSIAHGAPGQVVVSWPVSISSLFTLVQSSSLTAGGSWTPAVPVSSAIVGLQKQVTLNAGGSATFYRLQLIDPNAP
jgi:hypothetical protein